MYKIYDIYMLSLVKLTFWDLFIRSLRSMPKVFASTQADHPCYPLFLDLNSQSFEDVANVPFQKAQVPCAKSLCVGTASKPIQTTANPARKVCKQPKNRIVTKHQEEPGVDEKPGWNTGTGLAGWGERGRVVQICAEGKSKTKTETTTSNIYSNIHKTPASRRLFRMILSCIVFLSVFVLVRVERKNPAKSNSGSLTLAKGYYTSIIGVGSRPEDARSSECESGMCYDASCVRGLNPLINQLLGSVPHMLQILYIKSIY